MYQLSWESKMAWLDDDVDDSIHGWIWGSVAVITVCAFFPYPSIDSPRQNDTIGSFQLQRFYLEVFDRKAGC